MTPGRLLLLLKRDLRRGFRGAMNYYFSTDEIFSWRFPYWALQPHSVPLHVVTGKDDWKLCAWMLVSFLTNTKQNWPITIHDDGTLPVEASERYAAMFPNLTVIWREHADAAMEPVLDQFPQCRKYRAKHPLGLKIFDVPHLTPSPRFMLFDSDLMFFKRPDAVIAWADSDAMECWFNRDVNETTLVPAEEAQRVLKVALWPRVNSGLCLLVRKAIDLEFCERVFNETNILQGHSWRIEQTLFALCASRFGAGGILPDAYEMTLGPTARPQSVARHYVGPVRDRFYSEGMERLKQRLAPPD